MLSHSIYCFLFERYSCDNQWIALIRWSLMFIWKSANQQRLIAINYDAIFQGYRICSQLSHTLIGFIFCLLLELFHGINFICSLFLLIANKIIEHSVRLTLSAMSNIFYFIFIPWIHNRFQLQQNSAIISFLQFYISFYSLLVLNSMILLNYSSSIWWA